MADNAVSTVVFWTATTEVDPAVLTLRILYKIFTQYVFAVVVVLALFGNVMSILVTVQKDNRKISTCNYMTALAVVDSNVTIAHGWALAWIFWAPAEDAPSELAMQGMWYMSYTSAILSGFYLAAMTIDRLIVVRFPMSAPRLCTSRRACITIAAIFVFFCSINVYMFFTFKIVESEYTGGTSMVKIQVPDDPDFEVLGNAYQLAIGTIAPFCIIVFCNLWIIYVLRKAAKETGKMGVNKDGQKTREKETAYLTRMLILVSIAYVVTSIPFRLYDVISVIPPVRLTVQVMYVG
ncbi:growth hormone secretagogue receptor type 1-like [Lineus longissimus]|uniref:growth hormone secretagogue receptor type 1-like n=1 Tax=Lineus longissimus TaxID=88925 RepID=UPI00315D1195